MYRQLSASIVGQTYTAGILTISNMYIVPNQQTTLCFFPTRHFSLQERIIWMKELYISHTGQHIRYVWTISIWLNFMVGFSGSFLGLYPAVNMLLFQVVFNPWNPLKVWDHGSRLPNIGTWIEGPGERERDPIQYHFTPSYRHEYPHEYPHYILWFVYHRLSNPKKVCFFLYFQQHFPRWALDPNCHLRLGWMMTFSLCRWVDHPMPCLWEKV